MISIIANWKITLSTCMMIVLLGLIQTASHAEIVSVEPGQNDRSLKVTFNFSYLMDEARYANRTFLFEWRQKTPQGEWQSASKMYSANWSSYYVPIRIITSKRNYTIDGLIPGTTYEVRVDSGTIKEGTTDFKPFLISTTTGLTETNLNDERVTLKLNNVTNGIFEQTLSFQHETAKIREGVTVSGINGVTIDISTIQRISDTEIAVELNFDGSDFDMDRRLVFSIDAASIIGDIRETLTADILVTALIENVSGSVVTPLTETTLVGSTVTLTLTGAVYVQTLSKIRDAVTVSGIKGLTIDTSSVQRMSDTEITVDLDYDETDFDIDTELTFSITSAGIANYIGEDITTKILAIAIKEDVSASVVSPLTETILNGSTITLTLIGATYEQVISKIRDAVSVSGIIGVTIDTSSVQRMSDTEITVDLDYDETDFDIDTELTFSITSAGIANYIGEDITTEIPAIAIKEGVSTSSMSPLTETTLDGSTITLTLIGLSYHTEISTIREMLMVSGIKGVSLDTDSLQRISDTEITVKLNYDGTDFDTNSDLTIEIAETALTGNISRAALTVGIPVTTVQEFLSASAMSPLTEATLNRSTVELSITGAVFEKDISKIKDAVTVTGLNGVSLNTNKMQRISNRKVSVQLIFDGTNFYTNTQLTFNVADGALRDHKDNILTAEILVAANRDEALLAIIWTDSETGKIQRANPDGSNVEDIGTQELSSPMGIALDGLGGKMYWTDIDTDKIQRANLDGSNVEDIVTQGLVTPRGIALDVSGGKMYWTDSDTDKIQRANLDGSNVEDLVTQGLVSPRGIALDVSGGKMYWTDTYTEKIQRANLDGSNVEDIVAQRWNGARGIALDVSAGKVYWIEHWFHRIKKANFDGSHVEDVVTRGSFTARDIALDVSGGKMYWTESHTKKIKRANLDGSNIEDLVTQGLGNPIGITIGIVPPVNATTKAKEDVNRDGVVNIIDLVIVSQQQGLTSYGNPADVNGDGTVDLHDVISVASVFNDTAAAPAARAKVQSHFTEAQLQSWLTKAHATGNTSRIYQRGIAVIAHLLTFFEPVKTALLLNYPNPFNPETWIPYQLAKPSDVTLTIYDIKGNVVRTLELGHQGAGLYQTRKRAAYWDGRNKDGEKAASGVYFYTFNAGDFSATRKLLIRK